MKTTLPASLLVITVLMTGTASAQLGASVDAKADLRLDLPAVEVQSTTTTDAKVNRSSAENRNEKSKENTENRSDDDRSEKDTKGVSVSAEHRSAVAAAVQNLLSVASTDAKIGPQISAIAQAQQDTQTTITTNLARVESRGKLASLLIGSDYKTLGALRSDLVKTQASIDQMNRVIDGVTNIALKTQLQAELAVLVQEQATIEAFVKSKESSFSLFGWAVKLFVK